MTGPKWNHQGSLLEGVSSLQTFEPDNFDRATRKLRRIDRVFGFVGSYATRSVQKIAWKWGEAKLNKMGATVDTPGFADMDDPATIRGQSKALRGEMKRERKHAIDYLVVRDGIERGEADQVMAILERRAAIKKGYADAENFREKGAARFAAILEGGRGPEHKAAERIVDNGYKVVRLWGIGAAMSRMKYTHERALEQTDLSLSDENKEKPSRTKTPRRMRMGRGLEL